jgi:hypothetical protein
MFADRPRRFAMAAANELSEHYGLSVAFFDKIRDGKDSPGYRLFLPKFLQHVARFEADPKTFYLTNKMVEEMGNIQLVILFDNVSRLSIALGPCMGSISSSKYILHPPLVDFRHVLVSCLHRCPQCPKI